MPGPVDITQNGTTGHGYNLQMPDNVRFLVNRTMSPIKKSLVLMLSVIKVFLSFLRIIHGTIDLDN